MRIIELCELCELLSVNWLWTILRIYSSYIVIITFILGVCSDIMLLYFVLYSVATERLNDIKQK